jgi:hypothetical protein
MYHHIFVLPNCQQLYFDFLGLKSILYWNHKLANSKLDLDALWGMYQWLDRAPKGRNEMGPWFRRHNDYTGE